MSAAQWRKAMNSGAGRAAVNAAQTRRALPSALGSASATTFAPGPSPTSDSPVWLQWIWARVSARHALILLALLVFPLVASPFFAFQIGAQSLILGLIALSLTFLAGYGGIVSLAQMTVAGVAGYMVAIFGSSGAVQISLGWPWWLAVIMAVIIATIVSVLIGWLSIRTEGIYTIMITLAIGVAFFYLTQQNYSLFNGFQGLNGIKAPEFWDINWRSPTPFYFVCLFFALAGYFFVKYIIRTPFGLALQGARDNARRMNSLGFNVVAHRMAAYAVAGFIAAVAGVLQVWYNGLIAPGVISLSAMINILVISVIGGMRHPIGPFIGAVIFILLKNFAITFVSVDRINLLIGSIFLIIVLFSPDGILGWWDQLKSRLANNQIQARITNRDH
jgi:branched-chain amino acid transport system permease protein